MLLRPRCKIGAAGVGSPPNIVDAEDGGDGAVGRPRPSSCTGAVAAVVADTGRCSVARQPPSSADETHL